MQSINVQARNYILQGITVLNTYTVVLVAASGVNTYTVVLVAASGGQQLDSVMSVELLLDTASKIFL